MRIEFDFNLDKAIEAMVYLVDKLGEVDKVKLAKLLYLADREHFLKYGYPITGDDQFALDFGPIPTMCLKAIRGELSQGEGEKVFEYLHVEDNKILLRKKIASDALEDSEKEVLDQVLQEHGSKGTWVLVDETHEYPEYKDVYIKDTSTRIPYELILKHYGNESQFRHNRPVISAATRKHMECPLPKEVSL